MVGANDENNFMESQLMPQTLEKAAAANSYSLELKYQ